MIKNLTLKLAAILAMMYTIIPANAADFTSGIYSFDIISESEATVKLVKAKTPDNTNVLDIPSTVTNDDKTYTVTVIGEKAISSINIYDEELYINIPASVIEIEDYGIYSCSKLHWISFYPGDTPILIGSRVLNSCSKLVHADIGRQFVYRDDVYDSLKMFNGKHKLESVSIYGSYENINDYEFANCSQLRSVDTHYANIKTIGKHAFENCKSLSLVFLEIDNTTEIGDYAFANTGIDYFIFPKNIKRISYGVLSNCTNLKHLEYDECEPEIIDRNAFLGCTALESFTIPSSVKEIHSRAFQNCSNLKKIIIEPDPTELSLVANGSNITFFENTPLEEVVIGRDIETYVNQKSSQPFTSVTSIKTVTFNAILS